MLRTDRLCVYIFILGIILIIPNYSVLGFLDEIIAVSYMAVSLFDCLVNRNWSKYKLLWIAMGIMTGYAIYSITCMHFNTTPYILMDWIIELKPFLPFIVMFSVAPKFTRRDKDLIRRISLFNALFSGAVSLGGYSLINIFLGQPYVVGVIIFISVLLFIITSLDSDNILPKKDLIIAILLLTLGLTCGRSKYYGMFVIAVASLLFYKPGITKHITPKHIISVTAVLLLVVAVSWKKIEYYFITGNGDTFDPTVVESFARPVLFATAGLIFVEYIPLGSGLASFATYPSQLHYSNLYFDYGIDKIHGLSPSMPDFICDAYFPSLAQFGLLGVILFVWFWVYAYKNLKYLIRYNPTKYRIPFLIGTLCICFILIECTGGNTFTQPVGILTLGLLGLVCGQGKLIAESRQDTISSCLQTNNIPSINKI